MVETLGAEDPDHFTYLWVAETIIRKHRRPLNARSIISLGLDDGLFGDRQISRTPQKSMQARLSIDILQRGKESRFLRTAKGRFFLRELQETNQGSTEYTAVRRSPAPPSENVLVIPRSHYSSILAFQGIDVLRGRYERLVSEPKLSYVPRVSAETDDLLKQFVTYSIIQRGKKILCFRRGSYNRVASFLRGSLCIGFGGHVTQDDLSLFTYRDAGISANASREIAEEVKHRGGRFSVEQSDIEFLGILNDDSSMVGVRHVAVVGRYWAIAPEWEKPVRGEASVAQLRWLDLQGEPINLLDFEYWSQLVLRKFFPQSVAGAPSFRVLHKSAFAGPHLLCLSGSIGSGKSVGAELFERLAGYRRVNSGRVLASILGIPPVPETPRVEFQRVAEEFISRPDGPDVLADALVSEANAIGGDRALVDGIRHSRTISALRQRAGRPVALVYVHTPFDIAFELYSNREGLSEGLSPAAFAALFNAPVESDVRYLIDEADAIIYNWLGLDSYRFVVESLVDDLGLRRRA